MSVYGNWQQMISCLEFKPLGQSEGTAFSSVEQGVDSCGRKKLNPFVLVQNAR